MSDYGIPWSYIFWYYGGIGMYGRLTIKGRRNVGTEIIPNPDRVKVLAILQNTTFGDEKWVVKANWTGCTNPRQLASDHGLEYIDESEVPSMDYDREYSMRDAYWLVDDYFEIIHDNNKSAAKTLLEEEY